MHAVAFKVTKLPGASQTYFFRHEGKRIDPTPAGVVLATRPSAAVCSDPWMKVEEVPASELKEYEASERQRIIDADAAAQEKSAADSAAKKVRGELRASGVDAKTSLDLDRALADVRAARGRAEAQMEKHPARSAALNKRIADLGANEAKLVEAGAKTPPKKSRTRSSESSAKAAA